MPPVVIAAGIGAVGAIGGAVLSSSAQKSAAKSAAAAQTQATDTQLQLGRENIGFQQGIYDKNTALLSPFVQRGNDAGGAINSLLGLGGSPQAASQPAAGIPAPQGYQTAPVAAQEPLNAMNGGGSYAQDNRGGFNLAAELGSDLNYADNAGGNAARQSYNNAAYGGYASPQSLAAAPVAAPQAAPQQAQAAGSPTDAFNNFANSAGMQFQLQQGENAINNGYAAKGQIQSGAAMKALQNYGQNTALNNYFLPYMGLLQGQQAVGAQSGSAIAGVGSNFGNTVSNIYGQQSNAIQNGADAQSNAALLRGQANSNMYNSIGGALGGFASSFFPSGGSGGGTSFGNRGYY